MKIGPYTLSSNVVLAPMAGVTDRPFRLLCRRFGAGLAASEMLTADVRMWDTPKSRRRMDHTGEPSPRVVQIAGFDPQMMADAARRNVDAGAEIIDINMGCPAKKVCNRLSGSALMQDEALVARILHTVVRAVSAPVTLKTRTGWNHDNKTVSASPRSRKIAAFKHWRFTAAPASTCIRETLNMKPSPPSKQKRRFPCLQTATSIPRNGRAAFWRRPDATAS